MSSARGRKTRSKETGKRKHAGRGSAKLRSEMKENVKIKIVPNKSKRRKNDRPSRRRRRRRRRRTRRNGRAARDRRTANSLVRMRTSTQSTTL